MTTTDINNEDSTPEKDLIQWEKLEAEWQAMNIKADTAQLALDHKFKLTLQGKVWHQPRQSKKNWTISGIAKLSCVGSVMSL